MSDQEIREESFIKFPCDFTLKVLGKNEDEFENTVLMIVRKHFPSFGNGRLQKRLSKNDQYLSLSITVYAQSKQQLDDLYIDLNQSNKILMAL